MTKIKRVYLPDDVVHSDDCSLISSERSHPPSPKAKTTPLNLMNIIPIYMNFLCIVFNPHRHKCVYCAQTDYRFDCIIDDL